MSVMRVRASCFLIKGKWRPGATPVPGARTWEMGTCTGANLGKKWTVYPSFAFTERIESDTAVKGRHSGSRLTFITSPLLTLLASCV